LIRCGNDANTPKFLIVGTHRETRVPVRVEIEAADSSDARRIANARGIAVDECVPVIEEPTTHPLDDRSWELEEAEYRRSRRSVKYRAMRRAVFEGTLGALIAWMAISSMFSIVVALSYTAISKFH
jgi:hypothetical protein